MGFFKKLMKAAATSAAPQPTRTPSPPRVPSGSSIIFMPAEVVVTFDPNGRADTLDGVAFAPRHVADDTKVLLNIVGEAFRQGNLDQVRGHYGDAWFPLYLVLDPDNPHDKHAVAVYTGNAQIGFLDKDDARIWNKLVKDAAADGTVIAGEGQCQVLQSLDGPFWGVRGYVWFGRVIAPEFDPAKAKKLTPAALAKAVSKMRDLADNSDDPETAAQARALARKAVRAALPLYSHAVWMTTHGSEQEQQNWGGAVAEGDSLFDECEANAFTTGDEVEGDLLTSMGYFADNVEDALPEPS